MKHLTTAIVICALAVLAAWFFRYAPLGDGDVLDRWTGKVSSGRAATPGPADPPEADTTTPARRGTGLFDEFEPAKQ